MDSRLNQEKRRILFDASVLADGPMDGIRRYTHEILKAIQPQIREKYPRWNLFISVDGVKAWPIDQVSNLIEDGALYSLMNYGQRENPTLASEVTRFANRMKRSVVKRLPFRRVEGFDLLHMPLPNSYSIYQHYETQIVMTVHDLCHVVCPQFQAQKNIDTLKNGLDFALQRNAKFIADSHSTARELHEINNVNKTNINTVHLACNRDLFRPVHNLEEVQRVRAKYRLPEQPYFFSLCTLEPRKNLLGLVKAFRRLVESDPKQECHLVLAGRAGWGDQEKILKTAASDRVHLIGRVDDEDLPVLYSQAMAFACMSYYEGFCLPLLEAMTCGCPVIHSDRSAMPEVADGAGVQAPPDHPEMIFRSLKEVVSNESLRNSMKQKSLSRADDFSWQKAGEQVLATYANCLATESNERSGELVAA